MTMNGSWKFWKRLAGSALLVLFLADAALAVFYWENIRGGSEGIGGQRASLAVQAVRLKADVERGQKIRASLPQVGKDCDAFYRSSFLVASSGYSSVDADLDDLASKAGVKISGGTTFDQKEVKDRGVTELSIGMKVKADYPSLIRFVNGIERSKNFYLLDDLKLASSQGGQLELDLHLHTYFRT